MQDGKERARSSPMKTTPLLSEARAAMLEQVMRVTGDDSAIVPFLDAPPASHAAHAALGRLISEAPVRLVAGCPLLAWLTGCALDGAWRDWCGVTPNSLWASLEFLTTIYGIDGCGLDPYEALELLRATAETDANIGGSSG